MTDEQSLLNPGLDLLIIEQIDADLRASGIDPEKLTKRFLERLERLAGERVDAGLEITPHLQEALDQIRRKVGKG